jgi:hypothetical protein
MTEHLYLLTIFMPLGTILLVFGMKYVSAAVQARSRALNEGSYRELAEKAVAVQSGNASSLSALQTALSEISTRLAAVEKILKEV